MQAPKKSSNEKERLLDLQSYGVLDTGPELCFDEITKLVSIICEVPVALISLVDENRQWFKSRVGLETLETPRDVSFCGHAILQNDIFEIPNAHEDKRFADNPLVIQDPNIVFYAGSPLLTPEGHNIGTLCVIDFKPKELSEKQKLALRILSAQVVSQLELKKANNKLSEMVQLVEKQSEEMLEERQKRLEEAKMATMGYLAGGLAHEINNPLSTIGMASFSIRNYCTNQGESEISTPIIKSCDIIDKTITRISKIVKGLQTISKDNSEAPMSSIHLEKIIENTLNFCRQRMKNRSIDLIVEGNMEQNLYCRSGQISQILIHLLRNSFQAVAEHEEPWVKLLVEKRSDSCVISVIDCGNGIELNDHIMDPFYTTKPVGAGQGLGLSLARAMAEEHGGKLLYDREFKNTKFDLILPREQESVYV